MKPLLLLPVLLGGTLVVGAPPVAHVTLSPLTKAAYLAALKQQVITKPLVTYPAKKQRGRISIPTTTGTKVFQDRGVNTDDIDQVQYEYEGYWPQFKRHLVVVHLWEHTHWLLVADDGQQLKLPGAPLFAPGLQRFAVESAGIEIETMPNAIQLFQWKEGRFCKVWETKPTSWSPDQLEWTSVSTLVLSKQMWTVTSNGASYEYAKLSVR